MLLGIVSTRAALSVVAGSLRGFGESLLPPAAGAGREVPGAPAVSRLTYARLITAVVRPCVRGNDEGSR